MGAYPAAGVKAEQMQAQIRIYTINKGELDPFIKHCKEETKLGTNVAKMEVREVEMA